MAQKLSQLYDVDNRYREAKGVPDNNAGKAFLQQFRARDKELAKNEKDLEKGGEGGEVNLDTKAGEGEKGEVKPEATPPTTGEETKGENLTEPQKFNKGGLADYYKDIL